MRPATLNGATSSNLRLRPAMVYCGSTRIARSAKTRDILACSRDAWQGDGFPLDRVPKEFAKSTYYVSWCKPVFDPPYDRYGSYDTPPRLLTVKPRVAPSVETPEDEAVWEIAARSALVAR
jgi:hypothetical protein